MSVVSETVTMEDGHPVPGVHIVRGFLWREWLAYGRFAAGALAIYFVLGWVLLVFYHPTFITVFGMILVALAGAGVAGSESLEGSEEFALSLPPRRSERYLVRLGLWGGGFLLFLSLAALSIALDLPQKVWGLFVETGFTEPFPKVPDRYLYPLAVTMPFAAFAFTFVIASLARTRGTALWSAFFGTLAAAAVVLAGILIEMGVWDNANGWISIPALLLAAAATLTGGYFLYIRKEGITRPAPMQGGRTWWVWVIVGVVLLFLMFAFLLYSTVRYVEERPPARSAAPDIQVREAPGQIDVGVDHVRPARTVPAPDNGR